MTESSETEKDRPRGRWAPTPSGEIHVGNARTALAAWLSIRRQGGTFVWRLEDLDGPRTVPGLAAAAEDDLRWLGLDWDEGPGLGGPFEPYVQSRRAGRYEDALKTLHAADRLFPCRLSRAELKRLATAPHGREGTPPYPASLRPEKLPPDWFNADWFNADWFNADWFNADFSDAPRVDAAIRFKVDDEPVTFRDQVYGETTERVDLEVGDFVLKRRDGVYAYQLAVVVDDLAMEIDEVVRGRDLLDSTARQIQLTTALGGRVPRFAHLPLVNNARGEKLSKRDAGLTVRSLRQAGVEPGQLVGYLAWSLGLLEAPRVRGPAELTQGFVWDRVSRDDWTLPEDLPAVLGAISA